MYTKPMPAHRCHRCQAAWESPHRSPGRTETCEGCGADLHCCLNCRFYAPTAPNECTEPNVERILDKEMGNFCDYFEFAGGEGPAVDHTPADDARQSFEDLFKS